MVNEVKSIEDRKESLIKLGKEKGYVTYEQIADELLVDRNSSIAETAYSCGFNDISYFNRCFLKSYGKTPSEYRK